MIMKISKSFRWSLSQKGYMVVDGRLLSDLDSVCTQKLLVPCGDEMVSRAPLQESGILFRKFSKLDPTNSTEMAAFAKEWGLLGGRLRREFKLVTHDDADVAEAPTQIGEMVDDWDQEIRKMRATVDLWKSIRTDTPDKLNALICWTLGGDVLIADGAVRDLTYAVGSKIPIPASEMCRTLLRAATPSVILLFYLRLVIEKALEQHGLDIIPAVDDEAPTVVLEIRPRNLVGTIWLQFADAVERGVTLYDCAHCGMPIERPRGSRSKEGRNFCAGRCRQAYYWEQKGKVARELHAEGISLEGIRARLKLENTSLSAIRRLIGDHSSSTQSNPQAWSWGKVDGKGPRPRGYSKR